MLLTASTSACRMPHSCFYMYMYVPTQCEGSIGRLLLLMTMITGFSPGLEESDDASASTHKICGFVLLFVCISYQN